MSAAAYRESIPARARDHLGAPSCGVGQANVSYPFARFSYLVVAGLLVGHDAAGFLCSTPLLFLGMPHLSSLVTSCQLCAVLTQQIWRDLPGELTAGIWKRSICIEEWLIRGECFYGQKSEFWVQKTNVFWEAYCLWFLLAISKHCVDCTVLIWSRERKGWDWS